MKKGNEGGGGGGRTGEVGVEEQKDTRCVMCVCIVNQVEIDGDGDGLRMLPIPRSAVCDSECFPSITLQGVGKSVRIHIRYLLGID